MCSHDISFSLCCQLVVLLFRVQIQCSRRQTTLTLTVTVIVCAGLSKLMEPPW